MPTSDLLSYAYYAYLSSPSHERLLYRAVHRHRPRSIVEIGVQTGRRAARLIPLARKLRPGEEIRYTGIDLFEARPADSPGAPLKRVHRLLKPLGARTQLVPGDPVMALAIAANTLVGTDLLVLSADQGLDRSSRAWLYVPRMLHAGSHVLLERIAPSTGRLRFQELEPDWIAQRARALRRSIRRVA